MLVDIKFEMPFLPPVAMAVIGINPNPPRIQKGIYLGVGYNFTNIVGRENTDTEFWGLDVPPDDMIEAIGVDRIKKLEDECEMTLNSKNNTYRFASYGVVDSPGQFIEKFTDILEASPIKLVVGMTNVFKADEPSSGGWRWHKWGPYLGENDPQHEYIYWEEKIDQACCFTILSPLISKE